MDVVQAVSGYILKMVSAGESTAGTTNAKMKILLLDSETVQIVSTATTQSALLNHDVYLTDRLDNPNREKMRHLRCLCFVRPSPESIQLLIDELRDPKYGEYHLYFSNIVKKSSLERLAEADDHEVVRAVQEHFGDFEVINPDLMSLGIGYPEQRLWGTGPEIANPETLQRSLEGVLALLLSLKKKPVIRYCKNSRVAMKLATEVRYQMTQEEQLFDFRKTDTPPILLVLDRREDPLTPLLTQWTYQAMVHELLGIHTGRVDLSQVPDVRPELREIVLSQDSDAFFKKNMYANFGDLGDNCNEYVKAFASKNTNTQQLNSIADMKHFVENYPEFRKLSGNVTKHVTLVYELSRRVEVDKLFDVSELEQSLACSDDHTSDLRKLQQLLGDPGIKDASKLRLVLIYALRYANHTSNSLPMLRDQLSATSGLSSADISLIARALAYARSILPSSTNTDGPVAPIGEFLAQQGALISGAKTRLQKGFKGIDNVYMQHNPILLQTLESLIRGKLSTQTHPFLDGQQVPREKPQDVIVFIVGGATFEEAKVVAQVNASTPGVRVVLGGSSVLNSQSFLAQVEGAVAGWPEVLREVERGEGAKARLGREVGRQ